VSSAGIFLWLSTAFRISSERTEYFSFYLPMHTDEFPHELLRAFVDFVLKSCPNLQKMLIE